MKKQRSRRNILFKIAVFAFVVYVGVTLIHQQIRLSTKQAELASLTEQYTEQTVLNEKTNHLLDTESVEQFTESIARDELNYAKPGERVFINASGN